MLDELVLSGLQQYRRRTFQVVVLVTAILATALPTFADIFEANRRLGRGINLGNYLEPPRNASWGIPIHEDHIGVIKQAGFDSIRIPVKWSDYALDEAPYTIEASMFRRVDGLLARAQQEGLNVVLNIHHYDGLDADPDKHTPRFVALWEQIAARYQDRGEWLYFELDNEPHDKLSERWNDVFRLGLAAVRKTNPERPVIIGPPHWNGIWALPQLDLPDDPNIIVTVHMYNPFEFTHQGASWAGPKVQAIRDRTWGSDDDREQVAKELEQAAAWGKQHKRPIYVGEFGAFSAGPMESRIAWTTAIARGCEERGMSWSYWEFAAGFGAYDLETKSWREGLLRSLVPKQR